MKVQNLMAPKEQGQRVVRSRQAGKKHLLLRHHNFVAKSPNARREVSPLACEASTLTTELIAHVWLHVNSTLQNMGNQIVDCLTLENLIPTTSLESPAKGYILNCKSEGKIA